MTHIKQSGESITAPLGNVLNEINQSEFESIYRWITFNVTIITFCHGIGLGWFTPMLAKLQSDELSPLSFTANVEQGSWMGALICMGGLTGNIVFGQLLDRIGRKACLLCLAVPHLCFWTLVYSASSIQFLYVARFCGGVTGGGTYVVIPIFIGEIADPTIRGRLTSLFTLTLNTGMFVGFIVSAHVPYHLIPCIVAILPLCYLFLTTFFPESPPHLLHRGCDTEAEESLKFYRSYKPTSKQEMQQFNTLFADLQAAVTQHKSQHGDVGLRDFLTKRSLRALCTGILLMLIHTYSGTFALINYMSSIFVTIQTELHPDTNTIIIGLVQIVGTYTATILVDRFGRKILLIVSTASMGVCLATFGMYAFFAEEPGVDLSPYRSWLPLLLMALIIFSANVGIIPVPFIVLVEIMPPKIRSKAATICLALLSVFAFALLKVFPVFMNVFGLSATMWFCASVCAFGLFYITLGVRETKGTSVNKVQADD